MTRHNLYLKSEKFFRLWPDFVLIIILALLPLLFFWRLITPNPADGMVIAAGDFTDQYFPLRAFTAQEWVRGHIPLWNPYLFGGQPALADIQSGALYPPHLLESLLLGWGGPLVGQEIGFPLWALQLQVIAHFSLAGIGTYLFARSRFLVASRSLRRARFGAVIASLVFTYSGYLTGFPVQQITILEVSAWLPWIMWGLSAALAAANRRPPTIGNPLSLLLSSPALYGGALALAMSILAGHPQTVLYSFYLTLAYTLVYAFYAWYSKTINNEPEYKTPEKRFTPGPHTACFISCLAVWLFMVLLGTALAAAQLLPTLEFITRSLRADLSYQAVSAGLPLNELITILYPGFFGGSPAYVGIITLVFIALALILPQTNRLSSGLNLQTVEIFFWAGAGVVSLLLAFGGHTFLYPLFYLFAPGFEAVRQQERILLIYSFSAAWLAGYGAVALTGPFSKLTRLRYARFERRLRQAGFFALILTGFFIYGSAISTARGDKVNLFYGVLWHHLFGLMLGGGMLVWLMLRPRRWLRRTWGMGLIAVWLTLNLFTVNWQFNLQKPPQAAPYTPNAVTQFLQKQGQNQVERIVSGGLLPGGHNAALVFGLPDLTGNTPLQLATVDTFLQQMPAWRAWQLLNVRYVVDQRDIGDAGLSPVLAEGELKVFELRDPFPRAWFVSQTEVITADRQALTRLSADDFDLRRSALVTRPLPLSPAQGSEEANVQTLDGQTFKVETPHIPRLLVFSQIYYPGWQAAIDDQPAELQRVNVILQGVVVPGGTHTITLSFNPAMFRIGGMISLIATLLWLVGLGWGLKK